MSKIMRTQLFIAQNEASCYILPFEAMYIGMSCIVCNTLLVYKVLLLALPESRKALLRQFGGNEMFAMSDQENTFAVIVQNEGTYVAVAVIEQTTDQLNMLHFACRRKDCQSQLFAEISAFVDNECPDTHSRHLSKRVLEWNQQLQEDSVVSWDISSCAEVLNS